MIRNFFFIFCLFGLCLWVQDMVQAGKHNATTPLEEVVVTAGRFKELKREVTNHITTIDEHEIEMSTARDLGDLMAEKNIGHIQKYAGALTSVGIRGFRTETHGNDLEGKVLVLLNGRRAATGNLAKIQTRNIERVEIIRGPASVQYGSAAIGGLVNVVTKQGRGKPSVSIGGELGSFGYEEAMVSFSGAVKGFDFSGSLSRSTRDDYDTGDDESYDNTGYDEIENISLNLGYEFLPNNRVGVIYSKFEADGVGSPSYISQNDPDDYNDKSNESVDFIYDGSAQDGLFSWRARYFDGEDDNTWVSPGSYRSIMDTDQEGAQAQLSWNPENYRLTAGFDWINYEVDNTYSPTETEYDNPSYFLLAKAKYFDKSLILSGGARYDEYEVEVKEGQGDDEDDDNITPRFGIAYLPVENLKLRAHYAEGFKMPSAQELAGNFVSRGINYVGNPSLDPEESQTYEAGVDFYYKALDTSLTYFYTDFEDKIQQTTGSGGVQTWENVGEATVSGFEGEISYDLAILWNLSWHIKPFFNLTYLTEYEDDETDEDLLSTSDINISYGLSISDYKGLSARLNFAYTGEQDVQDFEQNMFDPPVVEKGGFTVANLSVQKRLIDFSTYGDLTLRGEIRNLLDKDYSYVKGYPMPGRSFLMGLEYTY